MFKLVVFIISVLIMISSSSSLSTVPPSDKISSRSSSKYWSPSSFQMLSDQYRNNQRIMKAKGSHLSFVEPILINQFRDAKEMRRTTTSRRNKVASELLMATTWPPTTVVKFDDDDSLLQDLNENKLGNSDGGLIASGERSKKIGEKLPHQLEIDQLLVEKYQPQVLATLVDSSQLGDEKSALEEQNVVSIANTLLDHRLSLRKMNNSSPGDNSLNNNNNSSASYEDHRTYDQQVTRQELAAAATHRKEGPFFLDEHKQRKQQQQQEHERWLRNQVKEDDANSYTFSTPTTSATNSAKLTATTTTSTMKSSKRRKPQQQRHNSQQVVVSVGNKGANGVEKPPLVDGKVLLAKDVSVRSDLLFIRTSNESSQGFNGVGGIEGLASKNLSGSVELSPRQVGRQVWTRRHGALSSRQRPPVQLLELAANDDTTSSHRLIIDLGEANLEEVEETEPLAGPSLASVAVTLEEPAEASPGLLREDGDLQDYPLELNQDKQHQELISGQTHAQLRTGDIQQSGQANNRTPASSSTSTDIKVSSDFGPEALMKGLVINHRGLIMAAKKGGSYNQAPYNFSALYANHVDHSLSPINKTHLHHHFSEASETIKRGQQHNMAPTHLPAFLHQRPPTVSSIIWRNHTSHPHNSSNDSNRFQSTTYHLIGGSVDGGPPYLVPSSTFNPMSIFTDLAVSEQDRYQLQSTTNTSTTTTKRPTLTTEAPSYQLDGRGGISKSPTVSNQTFHHNPPYKHHQSHQQPQLDLATTQQIVQAYDNRTLALASMTRRKQQPSSNNNKHHDLNRPTNSNLSKPSGDHHQQATTSTTTTTYDTTTPPFELNQTISSSLNAPLAAPSTTTNHQNVSISTSSSRPQANTNGKLMSKLQHMIIGKILKQQSSSGNMSSAGGGFVPSVVQWPTTTTNSLPIQQASSSLATTSVTPPHLLSTTVANNVANLIAQKLSTLFTKPQQPPTTTSLNQPASGLGLSSLFGYRVGAQNGARPVKQKLNPLIQAAHSPLVNRRTAGMGSILVSGLIYGLSVLPALMALTGVNPLTGGSSGSSSQQDQIATSASTQIYSVRPPRATASRRTTTTIKPSTTTTTGDTISNSNSNSKLQEAYAYLVPVISTIANSLAEDDFFSSSDTQSAQQTALKQLYAPAPTVIESNDDSIPVQLVDTNIQPDSLVGLANHPLSFVPSLHTMAHHHYPYQHNNHHKNPYTAPVYKSQLHYSSPLVGPSSRNPHWQDTYSTHQSNWHNPVTTAISTSTSTTPPPEIFEHTTYRSVQHHKTKRRDLHPAGSLPHGQANVADWGSAPTGSRNRAYHVGYTLNYKPVMVQQPQEAADNRHQQFIEFQSVNDMDQLMDQWRPIQVPAASSRSSGSEAKYNLNQGLSMTLMREDARNRYLNLNPKRLARVDEASQSNHLNQSRQRLRSDVGGVFTRYVKQPTDDDDR